MLYRVASALPDRPALVTRGFGRRRTVQVTYGQLLEQVERVAEVLALCGARRGETVALELPDCWGSVALLLACLRMGARVVPVRRPIEEQELERTLAGTGATLCVVLDSHLGRPGAQALLSVSERLPALRHRVVVGDAAATGALDFDRLCRDRSGAWRSDGGDLGPLPPDDGAPCLFVPDAGRGSPGTTGYRHRHLCAEALFATRSAPHADTSGSWITPGEVFGTSYPLARPWGLMSAVWQPVLAAGTGVFVDEWDAGDCLDLFHQAEVTRMTCPVEHWAELVAEQRLRPRPLPGLRDAASRTPAVPPELADGVREVFGVALRALPVHRQTGEPLVVRGRRRPGGTGRTGGSHEAARRDG